MSEDYPIREEWEDYYNALECIRVSGITNMFGAATILVELYPELSKSLAKAVLVNWINNYAEV